MPRGLGPFYAVMRDEERPTCTDYEKIGGGGFAGRAGPIRVAYLGLVSSNTRVLLIGTFAEASREVQSSAFLT